jgi:S-DNA-T family DNA segregation ATPase FtsK/SpoIIIE
MSLDTRLDILGVSLIIFALITILSYLSSNPGVLTRQWLRIIFQLFGWGGYVIPVAIGAIGVWLIWRHFGDQLPPVDPLRIAGIVLFFLGSLTLTHAITSAMEPLGTVYINPAYNDPSYPGYTETLIWEKAVACPAQPQEFIDQGWIAQFAQLGTYDIARCGNGGGFIGAFIQDELRKLLGDLPVFVLAVVGVAVGGLMMFRMTLKQAMQSSATRYQTLRGQQAAAVAATAFRVDEKGKMVAVQRAGEAGDKKPDPEKKDSGAPLPSTPAGAPAPLQGRPSVVTGLGPGGAQAGSPSAPGSPTKPGAPSPAPASPTQSGIPGSSSTSPTAPAGLAVPPRPGQSPFPSGGPTSASLPGAPGAPVPTSMSGIPGAAPDKPGGMPRPGIPGPITPGGMPGGPAGISPSPVGANPDLDEGNDEEESDDDEQSASPGGAPVSPRPMPGQSGPPGGAPIRPGGPLPGMGPGATSGRSFGPPPPGSLTGGSLSTLDQAASPRPAGPPSLPGTLPRPMGSTALPVRDQKIEGDANEDHDESEPGNDEDVKPASLSKPATIGIKQDDEMDAPLPPPDQMIKELIEDKPRDTASLIAKPAGGNGEKAASTMTLPRPATLPPAPDGFTSKLATASVAVPAVPMSGSAPVAVAPAPPRPVTPPVVSAPVATPAPAPVTAAAPSAPVAATPPRIASPEPVVSAQSIWESPSFDLLERVTEKTISDEELRQRALLIEQTLSSFGAPGRVVEVNHGPVITQFGVEPDYIDARAGKRIKVKVGKISALADDLALALAAPSIRIEAPVPGKGYVGIEVPNAEPSVVGLRSVIDTSAYRNLKSPMKMALGQDVSGQPIVAGLDSMPHLLIAGTTGSGKSVCVNGIICTMLMTCTPEDLKMIMVDPKRVELTNYNGIPHLMAPVVTELERIVGVLKWVQREMDERYRRFAMEGTRNIAEFNGRVLRGQIKAEKLPYILVVVDELADLMMLAPDETERVITRLAQMARATGIHIILSTQRPSVDVVTGLIKANFPARIAFAVATGVDSRVILDMPGAEKLLGRGDMLFQAPDAPMPIRMQGVYLSDREIQKIVDHWRNQATAKGFTPPPLNLAPSTGSLGSTRPEIIIPAAIQRPLFDNDEDGEDDNVDDLFEEAVELVRGMEKASISLLQRHLRIGYTRAARLIDLMEERGVIGPHEGGSKPRNVIGPDGEPIAEVSEEDDDVDVTHDVPKADDEK